jgi:hypothetical protein
MVGLIIGLVAGVLVIFLPPFTPEQYRRWVSPLTTRLLGVLLILFALASTSYVQVLAGYSAHLSRLYAGGQLSNGRIIATSGENGRQAKILPPLCAHTENKDSRYLPVPQITSSHFLTYQCFGALR